MGGGGTSSLLSSFSSPLGHLSAWPNSWFPFVRPDLIRAQEMRREAALCSAGKLHWAHTREAPGVLGVGGHRGRWEEALAKLSQSGGHQEERAPEPTLHFLSAARNAPT